MRSSLEVAGLTGNRFEQTTTFRLLSSVGQFEIKSRAGGGASTGSNTGPGGFLFFDVGNNNANYDALMALLKQLSGTPEPKKEAPSSLAAVKQKILANFMANVRDATYPVMRTGWEREVFTTVSNVNVVATDDAVTFSFRVKFERAADDYWEVKDTVMSFPYADLASPLSFSPQPNVYGNTTSVYLWANATGCNTKYVSTFKGESKHYDRTGQAGCERLPYDAGPSYQNFNELKALAQQLSGAPASAPTQTTANNPVPQTSTRPVVASSGNPAQDGVDQYAAKQYEQAIESFKAAIAKNPKDSGSSFNLGISYYNLKLYAEAVAALKQTIAIKPDWAAAYTELGNALDRSKHPAEAIAAFNKSLQLDPNNFATHYGLGNVQLGLDNRVAAIASYKEAVRIQPNFIACHKLLGTLYRYERLYTESIDSYRDALKINPDDLDVNIELGTTYFIAEQYTESIEVLKKAVEISPKSAKAFTYLGRSYLATKNYDLAISNLKMAVDIDKSDDFPHSLLGEAYCDQKNLPMALKEYNKLVALDSVLRFSLKPQRYPLCHRED